jgi:hypothetical protein
MTAIPSGPTYAEQSSASYPQSVYKQTDFLVESLHHPSLRAKKYNAAEDIWQARINRSWRFYFVIEGDTYIIIGLIRHPK